MIKLLTFLLTITLFSIASMWFIENDGSVIVQWLGYRIQTSITFSLLASLVLLVLLTTVIQIILWIKNAPGKYRKSRKDKKREQGLTALTRGFAAIAAGDVPQAKRLTKHAISYLGDIPLTKLLSAQTSQLEGNREAAKIQYTSMLENKETEIIAIKGLLLEAKKDGDINRAIFLAEKALIMKPDADWAILILLDLYKITKRWSDAEEVITRALKKKIATNEISNRSLAVVCLAKSTDLVKSGHIDDALNEIKKAYKILPDFVPIANSYASLLLHLSYKRKATKIIETCWSQCPHPDLATTYLSIFSDEKGEKKLKYIEKLLIIKPDNIEGHIAAARAALSVDLLDDARHHLKMALDISETRSACKLMAELEKQQMSGSDIVQQWLQRAETANSDTSWHCTKCGFISRVWSASCTNCSSFDSFDWESAPNNHSIDIIPPENRIGMQ